MKKENVTIETVKEKTESRDIAKKILEFGVTDNQKIDIMINLAMTIESNKKMKDIVMFLKKYNIGINNDKNSNNINERPNKILTN